MCNVALQRIRRITAIQTLRTYLDTGVWMARPLSVDSVLSEISGITGFSYVDDDGDWSEKDRVRAALRDLEALADADGAGPAAGDGA